jgi:hypothetical protein
MKRNRLAAFGDVRHVSELSFFYAQIGAGCKVMRSQTAQRIIGETFLNTVQQRSPRSAEFLTSFIHFRHDP